MAETPTLRTPGLDLLLKALREADLPVGVAELARLRQIFSLQPQFPVNRVTSDRLKSLLRAVLIKNDDHAKIFDRVFEAWLAQVQLELEPETTPLPQPRLKTRKRPPWHPAYLGLGLILLVILIVVFYPRDSPLPEPEPPPITEIPKPSKPKKLTNDELRKRQFQSRKPQLTVNPPEVEWTGWWSLGLAGLALFGAGGLWYLASRRRIFPERMPPPERKGPPRTFLQTTAIPQVLLDKDQQDALVWGIEHFVAEEFTRKLDIPTTVRATAHAAGIPTLHFERAKYQREVWLWVDEAADEPALRRLVDEIRSTLQTHGLTVETAGFRGIPQYLFTDDGQIFAPREIEERRDLALVAILTDGQVLVRHHGADDRRVAVDALLRDLSHWPRLWFVDFASDDIGLRSILQPYGLETIMPNELVAHLGGTRLSPLRNYRPGDRQVWAAACALAPAPLDEATAYRLRDRLKLSTSPWALRQFRETASGPPGRLHWTGTPRARLVNMLTQMESQSGSERTLLDEALDFWEEFYKKEFERRQQKSAAGPAWENTPAQRHLSMEQALLKLWRSPQQAITTLYELYEGPLTETIRRHLQYLVPQDHTHEDTICLPWLWNDLNGAEQIMLLEMGFADGKLPALRLHRPGRLWLGLGVCLGLAAGALWSAFQRPSVLPQTPPLIMHGDERPSLSRDEIVPLETNRWLVTVRSPKWQVQAEAASGAEVRVKWPLEQHPCVETFDDAELWRCPVAAQRLPDTIPRSLVVLVAKPETSKAVELARALLRSGSADLVLLDPNWPQHLKELIGASEQPEPPAQLIIIEMDDGTKTGKALPPPLVTGESGTMVRTTDWLTLTEALQFEGQRSLAQIWSRVQVVAGDPASVHLRGLAADCQPDEYVAEHDMAFIRLCPGTFMMGSPKDEPSRDDDEGPVHQVRVSAFDLGKFEVTNAQYRKFKPEHKGDDDLPAAYVSWHDAKAYCEKLGYRLPTEAEWEYAARADTRTRWSFGDDEEQLGLHAWYGENSDIKAHPVGTRKPNPWGLHDMHGNVWEWVADWYGPYPGEPQVGPSEGKYRVLRGGAFGGPSRFLRSAFRGWGEPELRGDYFGFRCARGPRRQP